MSLTPEERAAAKKLGEQLAGVGTSGRIKVGRGAVVGLVYTVLFFVLFGAGLGLGIGYLVWHR